MEKVTDKNFISLLTGVESFGFKAPAYDAWAAEQVEKISLTGSEKQVAWAKKIMLSELKHARVWTDYTLWADHFKAVMEAPKEASWWIDHREYNLFSKELSAAEKDLYEIIKNSDEDEDQVAFERAQKIMGSISYI